MSNEKTYTAREVVRLQREAFANGAHASAQRGGWSPGWARDKAQSEYPMPKVTRPRVVRPWHDTKYRVVDGRLQFEVGADCWCEAMVTADGVRVLYDLLINPTEEVEVADD